MMFTYLPYQRTNCGMAPPLATNGEERNDRD